MSQQELLKHVVEVQGRGLDLTYLNQWAAQLGVEDEWQRLQSEAERF
jgi:hypothetical protein